MIRFARVLRETTLVIPDDAWDHCETLEQAAAWTLAKNARERSAGRSGWLEETVTLETVELCEELANV